METGTVLIVDDDQMIRELYEAAFAAANVPTITAANGTEAVSLALLHHPSVILMDIILPDMTGHDAITKIRNDSWGKSAKVIYLTNLSDAENVVHAVERGSDDYIIKANAEVKEVVNRARTAMYSS